MEILPGIHQINVDVGNRFLFQYVFVGERIVVADSGVKDVPEKAILPYVTGLGRPLSDIWMLVVTHGDADHFGGNDAIRRGVPSAIIACPRADLPWVESRELALVERYSQLDQHGISYSPQTKGFIADMMGPDTGVDLALSGGEILRLDDSRELELVNLPGHTPGHMGLYDSKNRAAFIADAVLGRGCPDTAGNIILPGLYNDPDTYLGTVRRLEELEPEHLFLSHYLPKEGKEVAAFLKETRDFVEKTEEAVISILEKQRGHLTLRDIWTEADPILGSFGTQWVELAISIKGHLDRLVRSKRAEQGRKNGLPCWWLA